MNSLITLLGLFVVAFALYLVTTPALPKEGFGTSPGTMVQLATSHVPTEEDAYFYSTVYPRMVRHEIWRMTEEDPGEFRPWIFPWYGRGVTLVV